MSDDTRCQSSHCVHIITMEHIFHFFTKRNKVSMFMEGAVTVYFFPHFEKHGAKNNIFLYCNSSNIYDVTIPLLCKFK